MLSLLSFIFLWKCLSPFPCPFHHVGRRFAVHQFALHEVHIGRGVLEEAAIAGAEIVVARLAVGRKGKAIARTFAVAGKKIFTFAALARKQPLLVSPEVFKRLLPRQFSKRTLHDVAQFELREHVVVAHVKVAVVLQSRGVAAGSRHAAHGRQHAHPARQRGVENLNEIFAHITHDPFVEQGAEKFAPRLGRYREGREFCLPVLDGRGQAAAVGVRQQAFHDGGELNVAATYFLEEMIETERVGGRGIVHYRHGVPLHAVAVQQPDALHHLLPRAAPRTAAAVAVVEPLRAVDREADEEIVLMEKVRQFRRDERAVGLQRIDDLPSAGILLLQPQHVHEKT